MPRLRLALLVLLGSVPAFAQAHPCDTTAPQNPSTSNPYSVQFCWDLKDLDGLPVAPATVQIRVTIDGVAQPMKPLPAPLGTPSATGWNLYDTGQQITPKGAHSVVVALVTADGEGVSAPFAYTVKGKAPKPPLVRVVP